jgi:uncharacterized paraquat-inducible protein A
MGLPERDSWYRSDCSFGEGRRFFMEVVLALATIVVIALGLAHAPGRWRRSPAQISSRPRERDFLAVCSRCAEIVEADAGTERCPACGATLAVRRRIVDRRAGRTRSPASR